MAKLMSLDYPDPRTISTNKIDAAHRRAFETVRRARTAGEAHREGVSELERIKIDLLEIDITLEALRFTIDASTELRRRGEIDGPALARAELHAGRARASLFEALRSIMRTLEAKLAPCDPPPEGGR